MRRGPHWGPCFLDACMQGQTCWKLVGACPGPVDFVLGLDNHVGHAHVANQKARGLILK